jgi:hypothetical protein
MLSLSPTRQFKGDVPRALGLISHDKMLSRLRRRRRAASNIAQRDFRGIQS